MPSPKPELYIGLMSGTSMDGIDAALVDFSSPHPQLIQTHSHAWPDKIQQALITARDIPDDALDQLTELDNQTAEVFAEASMQLLEAAGYRSENILAIGNHGQTIRHRPDIEDPYSLQIGNAKKLSATTGISVISNFRTADIEAGGQGAPLAPAFHQAVFRSKDCNRVIVNIGGISNITVLPKNTNEAVTGFDCGPGNTIMDAWTAQHTNEQYDANGHRAASGKTNVRLLANMLMDDFFSLAPPKSTGFEYFNLHWLSKFESQLEINNIDINVMLSTLCDLTATSIIRGINQYAKATDEIYICGGGVHNDELMRRLQKMTSCPIATTEKLGVHPDWVEAMAFAWLAYRHQHQLTGNLPSVTGAERDVVLGQLTPYS